MIADRQGSSETERMGAKHPGPRSVNMPTRCPRKRGVGLACRRQRTDPASRSLLEYVPRMAGSAAVID
jgi:hypothetical protein